MTKCPYCHYTTDHKSIQALSECTAKMEGWIKHTIRSQDPNNKQFKTAWWTSPSGSESPIPNYLGDPAQTARMLEWLYRKDREDFSMEFDGEFQLCLTIGDTHNWFHGEFAPTIHCAYHTAKLAEWVAKNAEEKTDE